MKLALDFLLVSGILLVVIILLSLFHRERDVPRKILAIIFSCILLIFLSYYSYLHRIRPLFVVTFRLFHQYRCLYRSADLVVCQINNRCFSEAI